MIDKHDHYMPLITVSGAGELALVTTTAASLRTDCAVVSPPGAGCFMGVPWWAALVADCPLPAWLDCGQAAGHAAAALRAGLSGVIVSATAAQHDALVSLACMTGGHVLRTRPHALDLPARGARDALERYLRAPHIP
ncbi:hypothetical protein CFR75_09880 [Komagataeibacter xylinus]|uniref:Uncharacterized protein n=2 Tax=Komagataeibacter xylinus TaxID=28448 RepID=A0A318PIB5_KOMXY|nr:hypothetical protein CXP35_11985 [Komagataeibacter xylinus]PYD56614.1 hypothetical protein CFR75_09880 [Komagataeibacter xylinus]GBQ81942.1 hypothetical protein AA15237_3218 [Komagataeibacter xylinus NBRC 15237]